MAIIWDIPLLMTTYRTGGGCCKVPTRPQAGRSALFASKHSEGSRLRSHKAGASNSSCLGCCVVGSNPYTSLVRFASSGSKPSGYRQHSEVSTSGKYKSNLCVWVSFKSKITTRCLIHLNMAMPTQEC